jgi:hypothetical protein
MRPTRFQDFAVDLAKASDAASAVTLKEAGDTKHPFGLAAKVDGKELRFQVIAQGAPGEKYDEPEQPVEGDLIDPAAVTSQGGTPAERWLAGLIAGSGVQGDRAGRGVVLAGGRQAGLGRAHGVLPESVAHLRAGSLTPRAPFGVGSLVRQVPHQGGS